MRHALMLFGMCFMAYAQQPGQVPATWYLGAPTPGNSCVGIPPGTAGYVFGGTLTTCENGVWTIVGNGGSSLFSSYQFGSQTALTGTSLYLQTTYPNIFSLGQTGSGTSGSPYVDAITLASEAQNSFAAGPSSGGAGAWSFRAIVAADIPTLNQNTTGSAASATTATNLAGGAIGAVPYQTAAGTTAMLSGNTAATDQVVTSTGTGSAAQVPTLKNAPALSAANMTAFPTLNQNTTGNATTATGLASYPTACSGAQYSQGLSSGSNNCVALPQSVRYGQCDFAVGDTSSSSVLTNAQLGPQVGICFVPAAATILEVDIRADGGTPNIIVGGEHGGTVSNFVSSALASAASGARACSNAGGTTGIDGSTTCSSTLQNTSIVAGTYIQAVSGTAGGTAKWMTTHVIYSY